MKVDIDTIHYIAKLAKLKFTDQEAKTFASEFEEILNHIANIEKEDFTEMEMNVYDNKEPVLRKDEVKIFEDKKKLFQNVKEKQDNAIVIPKVVE